MSLAGADLAPHGRRGFVLANTRPLPVPLCPEITLRVADEAVELWHRTEEELGRMGLPPPFWAFAWAGGQALARYILDRPRIVAGRTVLDLGAGSGLVAIAAMRAGAASALACDPDPWALASIPLNSELNGVTVRATGEDLLDGTTACDLILVGDLFFDRDLAQRVLSFLDRSAHSGAEVLIGDPGRAYLPKDRLEKLAEFGVPTTRALEDAEIKRSAVWRLSRALNDVGRSIR